MIRYFKFKEVLPFVFLIVISFACRIILSTYGLPYTVHVDESLILKDPLKILLTYKNLDFHLPTNLYNYVLAFWHFVTFVVGRVLGKWHSVLGYENAVAADSRLILFSFRFLNVLLSVAADIVFVRFIIRKVKASNTVKLLFATVIVFNPIIYNSVGFVKFDAICYLFYALLLYLGYNYFVENRAECRKKLYLVAFLAVATRIEEVSFLGGFLIYDFWVIYKHSLKAFFTKKLLRDLWPGLLLYMLITLLPAVLVYNTFYAPKIVLTQTQTFEQVILSRLSWDSVFNYKYYIINSLMILSPVVLLVFAIKLFKDNASVKFLIIPLLITNFVLAFDVVKNVFYFLLSSVIILFIFIKFLEESKNKKRSMALLIFALFYFVSYDSELLYFIVKHNANDIARKVVIANTTARDTILVDGICDLRIPQSPKILQEQIAALKEVGGSTGYGLAQKLKESENDSANSRNFLSREEDYFWVKTKYEGKWLVGYDTATIKKLNPKLVVIFSPFNSLPLTFSEYPRLIQPYGHVLDNYYTLIAEKKYHFADPRMYYRNYYLFHSFFIFKRNDTRWLN